MQLISWATASSDSDFAFVSPPCNVQRAGVAYSLCHWTIKIVLKCCLPQRLLLLLPRLLLCFMWPQGTFNLKRQQIVERSAQAANLTHPPPFYTTHPRQWGQRKSCAPFAAIYCPVPHLRRAWELTWKEKKVRKACISMVWYMVLYM